MIDPKKDFLYHSYKIEYTVGNEMVIAYLDFKCTDQELEEWVEYHRKYIRDKAIHILTS